MNSQPPTCHALMGMGEDAARAGSSSVEAAPFASTIDNAARVVTRLIVSSSGVAVCLERVPLELASVELFVTDPYQLADSRVEEVVLGHCSCIRLEDTKQGHCYSCITGIGCHDQTAVNNVVRDK